MNFKRPLKAQKIRKITTIVSVFLAIFFTFEFGVKRLTGKIDPLQSNNIINSDEITFDSILNNPSKYRAGGHGAWCNGDSFCRRRDEDLRKRASHL